MYYFVLLLWISLHIFFMDIQGSKWVKWAFSGFCLFFLPAWDQSSKNDLIELIKYLCQAQSCISNLPYQASLCCNIGVKFCKWCALWTHCVHRTGVGLCYCSSYWKKIYVKLNIPPIWRFVSAFACSLGVSRSRLTERERMGTQGFRLIQRWMFCLWREQTMFEVIRWMPLMLFCSPL